MRAHSLKEKMMLPVVLMFGKFSLELLGHL